jgi:hypothetical protein
MSANTLPATDACTGTAVVTLVLLLLTAAMVVTSSGQRLMIGLLALAALGAGLMAVSTCR